jgi:uncharacterized protein YabN with tetrapyrrole methylase and pyrophosphatase domain
VSIWDKQKKNKKTNQSPDEVMKHTRHILEQIQTTPEFNAFAKCAFDNCYDSIVNDVKERQKSNERFCKGGIKSSCDRYNVLSNQLDELASKSNIDSFIQILKTTSMP